MLSKKNAQKEMTNGCGACSGFFKWLKPPHWKFFHNECIVHDLYYNYGGTEEDRKKADVQLYEDMVKHSQEYYKDRQMIGAQTWFILLSYLYYKAVRLFGKSQFNYRDIPLDELFSGRSTS